MCRRYRNRIDQSGVANDVQAIRVRYLEMLLFFMVQVMILQHRFALALVKFCLSRDQCHIISAIGSYLNFAKICPCKTYLFPPDTSVHALLVQKSVLIIRKSIRILDNLAVTL
jgi:hypothetical protein